MMANDNARSYATSPPGYGHGKGSNLPEDGLLVDARGFVLCAGERAASTLKFLQPSLKGRGPNLTGGGARHVGWRLVIHLRRLLDSVRPSMLIRLLDSPEHPDTFVLLTKWQTPDPPVRRPKLILITLRRPALLDWIDAALLRDTFELTSRELDVVTGLASGHTLASYAEGRHLSVYTVRTQVKQVLRKMGVHTQHQAVALALSLARRV